MDRASYNTSEVRSQICNTFLVVLAITAVPTVVASLYRITTIGWLPVMAVHIFLTIVACLFALFRKRIPYGLRAGCIVTIFFVVGFGALWQFGLIAPGIPFLVAAPVISALFFGTRAGLLTLIASLLSGGMIGVSTVLEHRLPPFDLSFYATQPSSWVLMIIVWVMVGGSLWAAMVMYNKGLYAALRQANQHEAALVDSELRFRDFADAASDVFWETDADHRLIFVSASSDALPDDIQNQAIGLTRWELMGADPSQDENWAQHRETMLAHEPFRDFRYSATIGGQVFHWRTSGKPVFEAGAFVGYRGSAINETGEILAQQRQQDAEVRFLNAVENLSEGLALWDSDDRLVYCNKRYRELAGTGRSYLREGVTFTDYLRNAVKHGEYTAANGREEEWIEERLARHRDIPNTTEIEVAGHVLIVHEERTPDGGVIAAGTDITELKQAEEELRETSRRLEIAQRQAKIGYWRWSFAEKRLTYWSIGATQISQYPMERGPWGYDEILEAVHPDDRQRVEAEYKAADEEPRDFSVEYRVVHDDGRIKHVREFGEVEYDENRQAVGHVGFVQDITELRLVERELRRSEQRLNAFFSEAPAGLVLYDNEGRMIKVNETIARLNGLPIEAHIGKCPSEIFPIDWARQIEEANKHVLETGEELVNIEMTIPVRTGQNEEVNLVSSRFPVFGPEGERLGVGSVVVDITDRLRAEDKLRQAQKMEAVGQLTGGVAHDFNNILAIILGNLELAESNLTDDDTRNHVEKAIEATERGAHLTQRLLAFSRKQALRPVPVDARKLIQDMQELLRRSLGETIAIEVVAKAGLWATEIDPGQLESALLNLAINARDAMPEGGKLTIETDNAKLTDDYAATQAELEPGQYVLVSISDTGAGMSPAVRDQAFDPFFTTKETGKGTGLGLSMVHGFVKQSGGHIAIYSEVGEGTTIKLYLPRYKGAQAAAESHYQADRSVSGKGEVVLVVEDDVDLLAMTINMLQSLGYRVRDAGAARGALDILEEAGDVHLLLTDVVLPGGMSGRALADRVRQLKSDLPVLFMSGYTEDAIIHHGRLDKGVQLLEKPFRRADLGQAIRTALDSETA